MLQHEYSYFSLHHKLVRGQHWQAHREESARSCTATDQEHNNTMCNIPHLSGHCVMGCHMSTCQHGTKSHTWIQSTVYISKSSLKLKNGTCLYILNKLQIWGCIGTIEQNCQARCVGWCVENDHYCCFQIIFIVIWRK